METRALSNENTMKLVVEILKQIEPPPSGAEKVHNDGKGNMTIGYGLNLESEAGLLATLEVFGFDRGTDASYISRIRSALSSSSSADTVQRSLDRIMAERALSVPGARNQFKFNNESEMIMAIKSYVDNNIIDIISSKISSTNFNLNSVEGAALISLVYNGGPSVLGKGLISAIVNNNHAEAWYEIRYRSNGGASSAVKDGLARRRLIESGVFGFNSSGSNPTISEWKSLIDAQDYGEILQINGVATTHSGIIKQYEAERFAGKPTLSRASADLHAIWSKTGFQAEPPVVEKLADSLRDLSADIREASQTATPRTKATINPTKSLLDKVMDWFGYGGTGLRSAEPDGSAGGEQSKRQAARSLLSVGAGQDAEGPNPADARFMQPLAQDLTNRRSWAFSSADILVSQFDAFSDGILNLDLAGVGNDQLVIAAEAKTYGEDGAGGGGRPTILLGGGDDVIGIEQSGLDVDGGSGQDVASYAGFAGYIEVRAGSSGVAVTTYGAASGTDQLVAVETIIGTTQGDTFFGGGGSPMVFAGDDGGDTYYLKAGDTAILGDGVDKIYLESAVLWLVQDGVATGAVYDPTAYKTIETVRKGGLIGDEGVIIPGTVWDQYAIPTFNIIGLSAEDEVYLDGKLIRGASYTQTTVPDGEGEETITEVLHSSWAQATHASLEFYNGYYHLPPATRDSTFMTVGARDYDPDADIDYFSTAAESYFVDSSNSYAPQPGRRVGKRLPRGASAFPGIDTPIATALRHWAVPTGTGRRRQPF